LIKTSRVERSLVFGASLAVALCVGLPAKAGSYTAEYVFGDSLSDRGNLDEYYAHNFASPFLSPPTFHGSFTNGDVSVQVLAQSLGLNANPSLWVTNFSDPAGLFGGASFVPGTNYAVAGATAVAQAVGGPSLINLPYQVGAFSTFEGGAAPSSGLYVVDIGGNDVRNAVLQNTGLTAVAAGAAAEAAAITTLADEGAKNFLIVNVPNVGAIPEFALYDSSQAGEATTYSQDYNTYLESDLARLTLPSGVTLDQFDSYAYNANILANAASLGFTNTTDPCYTDTPWSAATTAECGVNAENIKSFAFWDAIHPTAGVQALVAVGMEQAIPEPSAWAMLLVGFAALGAAARRRSATAARG